MRSSLPIRAVAGPILVSIAAGCASARSAVPTPAAAAPLPSIPAVRGPLAVRVVYPTAGALVAARDSTFIFGSVGTGDARLTINGAPVEVKPNGSFLAFLPVPAEPRYELVAEAAGDTARVTHPVRLLPPRPALDSAGPLAVDSASVTPVSGLALRPDEPVRVSVRATPSASVTLLVDGSAPRPLVATDGVGRWATDVPAALLRGGARLVVARGADSLRLPVPPVAPADTGHTTWAHLGATFSSVDEGDVSIVGRPLPGGTYRWFLLPGTQVAVTGRSGGFTRVRLDDALEVWVANADVSPLPAGTPAPRRVVPHLRVVPAAEWVDVVFPVGERPPYFVEETADALVLTLYGTTPNTDIVNFAANDSLVRYVTWEATRDGRARYTLQLGARPFGYQVQWRDGSFVLRVRRTPAVDRAHPLRGLRIAVDPGHPPIGATGPTGLYEAVAALGIAGHVERLLRERGAEVTMTRTTDSAVALAARPVIARRANAHALLSIHLNALPDGVNPFTANGTGTYYFHPHAAALARQVQAGMVRAMGLRDLGTWYDNLALVRPTWMPAVLCEGAFLMIPEQEAALRT
ncbi:MAG TPA: N-acetylmuramoyl-L-alanine amidase, partial [Gemmatimonadaceae bacterium]|nr:N-acetylmuramoyl-L-alanine amidase [Gemmatimonadaceae bacterium]